ncbi:hypothetical protein FKM82_019507 [Ascaphus truei]
MCQNLSLAQLWLLLHCFIPDFFFLRRARRRPQAAGPPDSPGPGRQPQQTHPVGGPEYHHTESTRWLQCDISKVRE